MLKRIVIK